MLCSRRHWEPDFVGAPESITIAAHGEPARMTSATRLQRIILAVLVAAFLLYGADYAILKARGSSGFDSVNITLGTPMKDGRVQIFTGANQVQSCVRSLFPHFGYQPCWYVRQNATQLVQRRDSQRDVATLALVRARDFRRRDRLADVALRVIGNVYEQSAEGRL
jgi:hypothetical protein